MAGSNNKQAPPYGTFGMFDAFAEDLKGTTVPDHIDRSMLSKLSGSDQTALLAGLRFLGLIEGDDDRSTTAFRRLIDARKAGTEEWKSALRDIIAERYAHIVNDVNVATTTKAKLQECFRNAGVPAGQMTDKSIRFYLKAVEESGETVSPHLKSLRGRMRRSTPGTPRRKPARKDSAPPPPPAADPSKADSTPKGFARLPVPGLEGAFIQYPENLSKAHVKLLEGGVAYLATFVEVREGEVAK